jgi:cell wall-associated NlpC family hydrolase
LSRTLTGHSRRLTPVLLAVVVSLAPALAGSPAQAATTRPAAIAVRPASPFDDAHAKARALRLAVDRLRLQAEQATEAYDEAYDELGKVVTAHLSAQQTLDDAVSTADQRSATAGRRVRALYMSGGAPALYATVLQGRDIADVLSRLQSVRRVVDVDRAATHAATRDVVDRTKAEHDLAELAARRTTLQAAVADRADRVKALLAETDGLLAQANARVRVLAEEQRRAAEAADARRAAAELARAQAQFALLSSGPPLPPGEAAGAAISAASTHLGKPYLWGATGPGSFDCSGLTLTAYRAAGINLPRTSREQWYAGTHVDLGALQPGDLLFWATNLADPATIHHVALYIGNGQMIAAPHAGANVRVQPVYLDGYIGAVRPTAAAAVP